MKEVVRAIVKSFFAAVCWERKAYSHKGPFPRGLNRKEEKELSSLKRTNAGRGGSVGNFG